MASLQRARITCPDSSYEGIIIQEKDGFLILKLDSGYNLGIRIGRIKRRENLAEIPMTPHSRQPSVRNPSKPAITLLLTGGTIASRVDYKTGGVTAQFTEESILDLFPEVAALANMDVHLVGNMASENIRFSHYNAIAAAVHDALQKGTKGVIIAHGTDTLHYTSAALSFIFPRTPVPIILTGSQRSSDRPSSDAARNLISAVRVICETDFSGVGVIMHEKLEDETCVLLRGVNCRKMHTTRRDAFKQVNTAPYARVPVDGKIAFLSEYPRASQLGPLQKFREDLKIGIIPTYPNMHADCLKPYEKYDGLLLEATGLGNLPIDEAPENEKIAKAIKALASKIPVAVCAQTIAGRICMQVYANSRRALALGVLGNDTDLTPETAYVKLAWLLSTQPKQAKELYAKNIVGEISAFSTAEGFDD